MELHFNQSTERVPCQNGEWLYDHTMMFETIASEVTPNI